MYSASSLTAIIILRWLFMSVLSLRLNAAIEGEVFVSSGNLFQARVTEGRKE